MDPIVPPTPDSTASTQRSKRQRRWHAAGLLGVGRSTAMLRSSTRRMTTYFESGSELLRGSSLQVLLGNFGAILSDSSGSEVTYSKSEPVQRMDWFISHNWSTPRCLKFMVLALHFNRKGALVITGVASAGILLLTAAGLLPILDMGSISTSGIVSRIGITTQVVGPIILLLSLFTWHEMGTRMGCMPERVFLDKTCIHQTDPEKKEEGILSLAAFLHETDGMLIIYTDAYLSRLWTCFELASLLILFPEKPFQIAPVFEPPFLVVALLLIYAMRLLMLSSQYFDWHLPGQDSSEDSEYVNFLLASACSIVFQSILVSAVLSKWARRDEDLFSTLARFSLHKAACFDESDRRLVINSVERFMKEKELVRADASREEVTAAFHGLVHREVPPKMAARSSSVPYSDLVLAFSPCFFELVDVMGAQVHDGVSWPGIYITAVGYLSVHFAAIPLVLFLAVQMLTHVSHRRRRLPKCAAYAYTAAISVLASFLTSVLLFMRAYAQYAELFTPGWAGHVIVSALALLTAALTWCAYSRRGARRREATHLSEGSYGAGEGAADAQGVVGRPVKREPPSLRERGPCGGAVLRWVLALVTAQV